MTSALYWLLKEKKRVPHLFLVIHRILFINFLRKSISFAKSVAVRRVVDCMQEQQLLFSYWALVFFLYGMCFLKNKHFQSSCPIHFLQQVEIFVWFYVELSLYPKFLDNGLTLPAPKVKNLSSMRK